MINTRNNDSIKITKKPFIYFKIHNQSFEKWKLGDNSYVIQILYLYKYIISINILKLDYFIN